MALDLYNGEIIRSAPKIAQATQVLLAAGDAVIRHPELPLGGLPSPDTPRARWRLVFHCTPASVQVRQHDSFLTLEGARARYVYRSVHGRQIAQTGGLAFR